MNILKWLVVLLFAAALGCGGGGPTGINKDKDRQTPPGKDKEEKPANR